MYIHGMLTAVRQRCACIVFKGCAFNLQYGVCVCVWWSRGKPEEPTDRRKQERWQKSAIACSRQLTNSNNNNNLLLSVLHVKTKPTAHLRAGNCV